MNYELKKPIEVYVNDSYVEQSIIKVSFTGKKGLKSLKSLQDVIFKTFSEQKSENTKPKDNKKSDTVVTVDEVLDILEMTGSSEKLFDAVMGALKAFGTIGESKLTDAIQEQMDTEDLDELYQEVLRNFLLPKITRKMNSMNK